MDLLDLTISNNSFSFVAPHGTPRKVREVVIGTPIDVRANVLVASIRASSVPAGATVTVNGNAITVGQSQAVSAGALTISVDLVGSYRLLVTFDSNQQRDLNLFGVELAAITGIVAYTPIVRSPLTLEQQTLIVRSLVNEPAAWFTGAAASLVGHSLVPFGA